MIESIKKISNPLTVIAIFAALAEISGTAVLPLLSENSQSIYVWFLVSFPLTLVLIFFATLNFNHKVLYAPSDFKDEDNFLKLFAEPTPEERISKIKDELINENSISDSESPRVASNSEGSPYADAIRQNPKLAYAFVEQLVLTKLSREFVNINTEVMLRTGRSQYLFDAVATKDNQTFAIEVKYCKNFDAVKRLRSSVEKIQEALRGLTQPPKLLLVIVTDRPVNEFGQFEQILSHELANLFIACEHRIYNFDALQSELLGS